MAISSLPTFVQRQILTAGNLNDIVDALTTKFSSAITGADLAWPLVAAGDVDFDSLYGIIGLKTFWNIINASEYNTLQLAIDAAEAAGGGCVIIQPDTTITTTGVTITESNIMILGYGPSSVIQLTSGTGPIIDMDDTLTDITIANLTIDGNGQGASAVGINAQRITRLQLLDLYIKDIATSGTGSAIKITNDGSAGQSSSNVTIRNVEVSGSNSYHLHCADVKLLNVSNFRSESSSLDGVFMEPSAAGAFLQDITLDNVRVNSPTVNGIEILGAGTADDKWSRISLNNCHVYNATDDAYQLGATAKELKHLNVTGCKAIAAGADAFVVWANYGTIQNCYAPDATGDGLDMTSSEDLYVANNHFQGAGAIGIDATSTDDCVIANNNVVGFTTEGITKDSSTDLECGMNHGEAGKLLGTSHYQSVNTASGDNQNENTIYTYAVPANTLTKPGDGFRIVIAYDKPSAGSITVRVKYGASLIGTSSITSAFDAGTLVTEAAVNVNDVDGASNISAWYHGMSQSTAGTDISRTGNSVVTEDTTTDRNLYVTFENTTNNNGMEMEDARIEFFSSTFGSGS